MTNKASLEDALNTSSKSVKEIANAHLKEIKRAIGIHV
jgi:hypothetical protein